MGREINRLTALKCERATTGRHADGGGLYLEVSHAKAKRWLYIFRFGGRRPEMGLGPYPTVTLAEARSKAADARVQVSRGINPLETKRLSEAPKFGAYALKLIEARGAGWKSAKHAAQWSSTLTAYCVPIWNTALPDVDTAGVLRCLRPIWTTKPETASRVRGRIEAVLNAARANGLRTGENPALWRGHLDQLLARRKKLSRGHHKALPYQAVPEFMLALTNRPGVSSRALELAILTASRTSEVLLATWPEFDGDLWTVPANRMKANREHRVPLTPAVLGLVASMRELGSPYVFPGRRHGKPLSNMALDMTLRRLGVDVTAHGFRSSFRDWAGDCTTYPREVIEAALAHLVGDKAEQAYRRGDALEKRRALMLSWEQYCLQLVATTEHQSGDGHALSALPVPQP